MTLGNLLRTLLPTLAGGLLLALVALPASAASWVATDPAGDAPGITYSPDPPPCGTWEMTTSVASADIRRVAVHHDARTVRVNIRLAAMSPRRELLLEVYLRTGRVARSVDLSWPGRGGSFLSDQPDWDDVEDAVDECGLVSYGSVGTPCRGLRAERDVAAATVGLTVPRRCLNNPRSVQVGLSAQSGLGFDRWGVEVSEDAGLAPVYGPMVPRG